MSFIALGIGSYWRPHEHDAIKKYFGEQTGDQKADYLFWRHNTEAVSRYGLEKSMMIERQYISTGGRKIINPMTSYKYTNNKDDCFDVWENKGISSPKCFVYSSREDFESKRIEYPFLLRLNDGVTGEDTYLVTSDNELEEAFVKVDAAHDTKQRIDTKKICVQFIDTSIKRGYKTSFRITVAGDRVVSGYGRVSDDWLAITKQFTEEKKDVFVEQNIRAAELIKKNHDEIVRSVHTLGLHHVGIDMIADKEDNIYFLEVQPFYFCGNPNRTSPPFWNPYKPKELVDWLVNEKKDLYKEIPLYYDNWLNKENHFDLCYSSLKEHFDVRT